MHTWARFFNWSFGFGNLPIKLKAYTHTPLVLGNLPIKILWSVTKGWPTMRVTVHMYMISFQSAAKGTITQCCFMCKVEWESMGAGEQLSMN